MEIRAHHLLCIPRFYGGGYTTEFGLNLKKICMQIRQHPNTSVKVIRECDTICEKCPYKRDGVCKKTPKLNKWILRQDDAVFNKLKIKPNSVHKAKDIFNHSMNTINSDNLSEICKGCVFLRNCIKVGVNNSFRKNLNSKK
ncbi:DUF1284 domain-containing protein [Candidatus Woesearchaeota archaeon]|nr:DUF1284 domain-containing protein [Candidatus Woesearchaeota archaeon]